MSILALVMALHKTRLISKIHKHLSSTKRLIKDSSVVEGGWLVGVLQHACFFQSNKDKIGNIRRHT